MSAAAGQIEVFKLPLREIRAKFTKSEVTILGWRSAEISAEMRKDMPKVDREAKGQLPRLTPLGGQVPEGLPDKFFDKDGQVDLSRVTGREAWMYFNKQGLRLPFAVPKGRKK